MEVEPDEKKNGPGKAFFYGMGGLMLLGGVLVVSMLAGGLQPTISAPAVTSSGTGPQCTPLVACVYMPPGAGTQQKNFAPDNITVYLGVNNTVVWTNQDSVAHTVVSVSVPTGSGTWSSPNVAPGGAFETTLNVTGLYHYECNIHPGWMQAYVVVKSGNGIPKPSEVVMLSGTGASGKLNFSPATITVVIGVNNTVTWVNMDSVKHTVTANDGSFNSGDILQGQTWSYTFSTPGTYAYHCVYHNWMAGTVVVKAAS